MGAVKELFAETWIDLSRRYKDNPSGPRVLPIVKIRETHYFVDEQLCQIRNIRNVDDFIEFETDGDMLVTLMQYGEFVS